MDPAILLPGEQPRALENPEVFRDGGQRDVEGFG